MNWAGSSFDRERPVKDCAKLMRADVKRLVKDGILPDDWRYSIRVERATWAHAIEIRATSPRPIRLMSYGTVYAGDRDRVVLIPAGSLTSDAEDPRELVQLVIRAGSYTEIRETLTPEAAAVEHVLHDIHRAYNYDASDTMTDYFETRYYGSVHLDTIGDVPRAERPCPPSSPPCRRVSLQR